MLLLIFVLEDYRDRYKKIVIHIIEPYSAEAHFALSAKNLRSYRARIHTYVYSDPVQFIERSDISYAPWHIAELSL